MNNNHKYILDRIMGTLKVCEYCSQYLSTHTDPILFEGDQNVHLECWIERQRTITTPIRTEEQLRQWIAKGFGNDAAKEYIKNLQ
jgi:hypothetical protein